MGIFKPDIDKLTERSDVKGLVRALKDSDPDVSHKAAYALARMGSDANAASAFSQWLSNQNNRVRKQFVQTLGNIGPDVETAVTALTRALKDSDRDVQSAAASSLGSLGTRAKAAIPALIQSLKDSNWALRYNASIALGNMGLDAKSAIPALIALLEDDHSDIRKVAVHALREIGPDGQAIPDLIRLYKDERSWVQDCSWLVLVEYLPALGPNEKTATATFIKDLSENDKDIRHAAARMLTLIGLEKEWAVPALIAQLDELVIYSRDQCDDWHARLSDACKTLAKIAPYPNTEHARAVVLASIGVLRSYHTTSEAGQDAVRAFSAAGHEAQSAAIDDLMQVVRTGNYDHIPSYVRAVFTYDIYLAINDLGKIRNPRVVEFLIKALSDSVPKARSSAATALGEIADPVAVKPLIELLRDTNDDVQESARRALVKIHKDAIPALKEAQSDLRLHFLVDDILKEITGEK